jgi:CDP-diacylglycerol--glycerol-3-phosphate 3-phosphatidyltransferase
VNTANYITFIRLFIGPLFFLIYVKHSALGLSAAHLPYVLIGLLAISELSDAIDGYFARRFNQVTDLGKILDPMADSISRISIFLTFTQAPVHLPLLLVFIFLYRDSVVSTLRTVCALRGFALAARSSGKIKAAVQATAAFIILGLMLLNVQGYITEASMQFYATVTVSIAAAYTLYSACDYIKANRSYITCLLTKPNSTQAS